MDKHKKETMIPDDEPSADLSAEAVSHGAPPKKRRRWWLILLIVFLSLLLVLTAVVGFAYWWLHRTIGENVQQAESYTEEELDVNDKDDIVNDIVDADPSVKPEDVEDRVDNVQNIALFGVDQEKGSVGRSDAMILLSIDKENKKIKMTSLARDSLVPIEGRGEEKLTHAWAYGHAKLAIKTINQAFGMNITDYVYVNFEEFVDVIDYIGGIEVHVDAAEMKAMNAIRYEWVERYGYAVPYLEKTGVQRLNGAQALSYARNRSDSDTNRTARQREVLIAMYEQVRKQPVSKLPDTLKRVLKLCHTNLSSDEIMDVATWAVLNAPTIESLSLPNAQLKAWSGIIDRARGWVRVYDLDAAKKVLYNFIYEVDAEVSGVTQYVPTTTKAENTTVTTTP